MSDNFFERINDYGSVRISLASPNDIRSWSYGEVKKPETINYRTYRAEKDGLFCERIFGPEKDWECFCGKYKGMKHKGIVCDRCGVKVTHSRVRRKRMGHITLAAPVVHIWFFKAMPSRISTLLDMKTSSLERVIYFQNYVVTDPGDTPLQHKQLLSEEQYRECMDRYGSSFSAEMGAEAVRTLLRQLDLEKLSNQLREDLGKTRSKQKIKKLTKRLKLIEALRSSENDPQWVVLEVIPVIPPDLRPLVLLDSGNFATCDLNDLYRRIINRNNRLRKLLDLNAPEVIIRNEKRMLQQAVDALLDNSRCKRPVLGSSGRPLKSLTDMIKGKQGRFRENLLGKRVDYSARAVIVVGPELKLNQCGLPKKIALELFQPFIIRRLKELGLADTIKSAKKMLERRENRVWDILEEVIHKHPVLLNRAPTLHRLGVQAFDPVLVEGNAIKLHPLVCKGFNADFDGDAMAVHLPLSLEAQVEARTLMLATNNIFSPAHGGPIISASQDIVLGCYYLTIERTGQPGEGRVFASPTEASYAYYAGQLGLHARVKVRLSPGKGVRLTGDEEVSADKLVETTPGRIIFNEILPEEMPFYNMALDQQAVNSLIAECYRQSGHERTIKLLDDIKELGFREATSSGITFAACDLKIPERKPGILARARREVQRIQKRYEQHIITESERHNQIVDIWIRAREQVSQEMLQALRNDTLNGKPYLNPIGLMIDSGARGSVVQVSQIAGMRGLMAKPSGQIIETPITSNFREGLGALEYFTSTHGGRKGLADTALKTAQSGYLTRKMADVAQSVVVAQYDCGALGGVTKSAVYKGEKVEVSLADAITGRTARDTIVDLITDEVIVRESELITAEKARRIEDLGYEKVRVRSPLTCQSPLGVCAKCYGADPSTGKLVEMGLAVGIIAAQSIGEPGTQLTLRTFHIGGTATRSMAQSEYRAQRGGTVTFKNVRMVGNEEGQMVNLDRNAEVIIQDDRRRELKRYALPSGALLRVKEGQKVAPMEALAKWDPHMVPILAEVSGRVRFEEIIEGETLREEVDSNSGFARRVIIEHKGNLHPHIVIEGEGGKVLAVYPVPEKAHLEVEDGQRIKAGAMVAKTPREITGTQDITGGLPRVTELLEARHPKSPAVMSEIDGIVELGEKHRGRRTIIVRPEVGEPREHLVPYGKHLLVHAGDVVKAGDTLVEGPLVVQDLLRIKGEEAVQQYLLKEVQSVYRLQDVNINDKHIEVIVSQMMRRVRVKDPGQTELLPEEIIDRFRFRHINQLARQQGKKPAVAEPLLQGITKSSLQSDSFISAASFQETTKVLTEAALAGRVDPLVGLKENVILGHLIPTGTGFKPYADAIVKKAFPEAMPAEEEGLLADMVKEKLRESKKTA